MSHMLRFSLLNFSVLYKLTEQKVRFDLHYTLAIHIALGK